jgi:hypothetical protein
VPFCILVFLLLAQRHDPGQAAPGELQKQVTALVSQIQRLAASEPAVYGVDTRFRAAEVLTANYPRLARDFLHEAQASLTGISVPAEQDRMRVRLVRRFAPLDLEEAERLTRSFHRGTDQDYLAQAYDQLYLFLADHPLEARRIITKGLGAGAFRLVSASQLLEDLKTKDPEAATTLFSEILAAFPVESPGSADVLYLLQQTRQITALNRQLAIEAIDKALRAATSESLHLAVSDDREKLLREAASLLESIDPELLKRYKLDLPHMPDKPPQSKEEKKDDDATPDLSAFPYAEALTRARKLDNLSARAGALIDISRREELTEQQRTSVASEALSTLGQLPVGGDRLFGLAMISRDFARRGELAKAALAAQILSETYSKACDCPSATCQHGDEEFDCLQNVEDFAEYLDEFKISPEAMSLDNISLQARLLVLKLHALTGGGKEPFRLH